MRSIRLRFVSAVVAATFVLVANGCGSSGKEEHHHASPAEARAYARNHLQSRLESVIRLPPLYRSASDLLGNVLYVEEARPGKAITDAVVVGRVSGVAAGYGFAEPTDAAEDALPGDGVRVPFDSPDAIWRTVHIAVEVEEVLTGRVSGDADRMLVGLAIGNVNVDEHLLREGLMALGRSVWFVRAGSPVFSYDSSLYADIEDGQLIAEVASDGRISFPMLEADGAPASFLGHPTLSQLREASKKPVQEVQLRREGGVWLR